jgi:hypothetical protein
MLQIIVYNPVLFFPKGGVMFNSFERQFNKCIKIFDKQGNGQFLKQLVKKNKTGNKYGAFHNVLRDYKHL